jgi:pyruvate dehydrogenase E2 component (dihydrolipoamide acetyltransferase)
MNRKSFEFAFPDIGEGLSEGKVLEWKVRPGQRVKQGQTIAVVETDKVVADIPSPRDGTLLSLGVAEGELIQVGRILAVIELEETAQPSGPKGSGPPEGSPREAGPRAGLSLIGELESATDAELPPSREGRETPPEAGAPTGGGQPAGGPVRSRPTASPVARKLAALQGVDLASVRGSGPAGRVLRKDVADASGGPQPAGSSGPPEAPGPAAAGRRVPLSTLRRTLAANMERSAAIPSAVIHELVAVEELVALRRELNRGRGGEGQEPRLSFLPFFLKFAALSLREYPLLNAAYHPERQEVEQFGEVNLGVAVDTEEGLQVPVVRQADGLSLPRLQAEVDRLAEAARGRALRLEQQRGGTFTVTNYGAFAGLYGRPLILPPQVGILGLGRIHEQPVARAGSWAAVPHLPLSLVFDHRVLDGGYASRFLRRFMELAQRPQELLLH